MKRALFTGALITVFAFPLFVVLDSTGVAGAQSPSATLNCDTDGSGTRDIGDAVYLFNWLFLGGPDPVELLVGGQPTELRNGNCNGDNSIDISDGIYILIWLFLGGPEPVKPGEVNDSDEDGVPDTEDNCQLVPNADQADADGDNVGDACDVCPGFSDARDGDGDTFPDGCDNCPGLASADQVDSDGDGVGNPCDNCPELANPLQEDADGDGTGDACEAGPTIYAGSLTSSTGRWRYAGMLGVPGANAMCAQSFPGSAICTQTQLMAAAAAGELVNATDTSGRAVASFWLYDPQGAGNVQCVHTAAENIPWTYSTAHLPVDGEYVELDAATGALGETRIQPRCNRPHHVACCNQP